MDLTERKKRILRAIIESYIQSAEPVGSKAIAASIDMEVSSATIRNEMADLTEMGYLGAIFILAGVFTAIDAKSTVMELITGKSVAEVTSKR